MKTYIATFKRFSPWRPNEGEGKLITEEIIAANIVDARTEAMNIVNVCQWGGLALVSVDIKH